MQPVPLTEDAQNRPHWKDAALAKAEGITDAWEVVKAYAGRAAEWVLFVCMIINIVEMLPDVNLSTTITNAVLGVQVVMLDIGGLSLSTMAAHARLVGDVKAAKRAGTTSAFLIGLMILTLLLVSIGLLFPSVKPITDLAEKGLILIRVVMTVIYSHVIHSLRSTNHQTVPQIQAPQVPSVLELEPIIASIPVPMLEQYQQGMSTEISGKMEQYHQELRSEISEQVKVVLQSNAQETHEPVVTRGRPKLHQVQTPALAQEREARLSAAYQELVQEGIKPTGQTLSARARCNRAVALAWLKGEAKEA